MGAGVRMQGQPFTGTCSEPTWAGLGLADEPPCLPLRCREVDSGSLLQDHQSQFQDGWEARKQGRESRLDNKTPRSLKSKLISWTVHTRQLCIVDRWTGVGGGPRFSCLAPMFPISLASLTCTEPKVGGVSGRLSKCHYETPKYTNSLLGFNQ